MLTGRAPFSGETCPTRLPPSSIASRHGLVARIHTRAVRHLLQRASRRIPKRPSRDIATQSSTSRAHTARSVRKPRWREATDGLSPPRVWWDARCWCLHGFTIARRAPVASTRLAEDGPQKKSRSPRMAVVSRSSIRTESVPADLGSRRRCLEPVPLEERKRKQAVLVARRTVHRVLRASKLKRFPPRAARRKCSATRRTRGRTWNDRVRLCSRQYRHRAVPGVGQRGNPVPVTTRAKERRATANPQFCRTAAISSSSCQQAWHAGWDL